MRQAGPNQVDRICAATRLTYPDVFDNIAELLRSNWHNCWRTCSDALRNQPPFKVVEHTVAMCLGARRSNATLGDVSYKKFDFEVKSYKKFRSLAQVNGSVPITDDENRFFIIISGDDKLNPNFHIFSSKIAHSEFVPRPFTKKRIKSEIIGLGLENEILRRINGCKVEKMKDQRMSFNISDPSGRKLNVRFDIKFSCK